MPDNEGGLKDKVARLEAKVAELEQLCDESYAAQEADAYHHACSEMERFQRQRARAGKEVGTEGSLCDGMGWLYKRLAELESQVEELKKK